MDVGSGRKRYETSAATKPAPRRRLKIYASDPMSGRLPRYRTVIDIENEVDLKIGPCGETLEVVDYDGVHNRYYAPVDLNDPALLMSDGLDPNESDPRFHQRMVYAVAMKVIESASGRSVGAFRSGEARPSRG